MLGEHPVHVATALKTRRKTLKFVIFKYADPICFTLRRAKHYRIIKLRDLKLITAALLLVALMVSRERKGKKDA